MKFGPGLFTIGTAGALVDASCAVNSLRIKVDKSEEDGKTMLCGTAKPGRVTYTYSLTGNVDTDTDDPKGLFALTAAQPGSVHEFVYTPNTAGTSASGKLVVDPLEFGGEKYGEEMTSDLEFTLVGAPVYKFPDAKKTGGAGAGGSGGAGAGAVYAGPLIVNGKPRAGYPELTPAADEPSADEPAGDELAPGPADQRPTGKGGKAPATP